LPIFTDKKSRLGIAKNASPKSAIVHSRFDIPFDSLGPEDCVLFCFSEYTEHMSLSQFAGATFFWGEGMKGKVKDPPLLLMVLFF
jgi:hypothetical protein